MSYIVTMLTQGGIVMAADRQITQFPTKEKIESDMPNELFAVQHVCDLLYEKNKNFYKPLTKSARKLFTIGDNMAFSMGQELLTKDFYPVELLADQFCRKNTFDKPTDAAQSLFDFMCSKDENMNLYIHFAGYDKSNTERFTPEFYDIKISEKKCEFMGHTGFMYAGANDYFTPYTEKLANQIMVYTVQDAIDICQLAIDMSRRLGRYLDFKETISPDEEIVAITPNGIQWVKKSKLEAR